MVGRQETPLVRPPFLVPLGVPAADATSDVIERRQEVGAA